MACPRAATGPPADSGGEAFRPGPLRRKRGRGPRVPAGAAAAKTGTGSESARCQSPFSPQLPESAAATAGVRWGPGAVLGVVPGFRGRSSAVGSALAALDDLEGGAGLGRALDLDDRRGRPEGLRLVVEQAAAVGAGQAELLVAVVDVQLAVAEAVVRRPRRGRCCGRTPDRCRPSARPASRARGGRGGGGSARRRGVRRPGRSGGGSSAGLPVGSATAPVAGSGRVAGGGRLDAVLVAWPVSRNPIVEPMADLRHARQRPDHRQRPEQRRPPGHGDHRVEARADPVAGADDVDRGDAGLLGQARVDLGDLDGRQVDPLDRPSTGRPRRRSPPTTGRTGRRRRRGPGPAPAIRPATRLRSQGPETNARFATIMARANS